MENTSFKRVLCIDVGATNTKYSVVEFQNPESYNPVRVGTPKGIGFKSFLQDIIDSSGEYDCIAIGFCGIVSDSGELSSINLEVQMSTKEIQTDKPLFVANDVFCNALSVLEKCDKSKSQIVIVVGTSVSFRYLYKGKIIVGKNNVFGEIVDVGYEIGTKYLTDNNLSDFSFLSDESSEQFNNYSQTVFDLIKLIAAIFAPDEIVLGGGTVLYHWTQELKDKIQNTVNTLDPLYLPNLLYQKVEDSDTIVGTSLLPKYMLENKNE